MSFCFIQLHNFKDEISGICVAAVKELTIENELKKMGDVWKEQKFDLFKYTKGTEDRGWLLRGTLIVPFGTKLYQAQNVTISRQSA